MLSKVPFAYRRATRQFLLDLRPSLAFAFSRRMQLQASKALSRCHSLEDYMRFASLWLTGGSIQIPEEIQGAVDCIVPLAPRIICEIGTDNGGTTFLLSHMLLSARLIVGIDLFVRNRVRLKKLHRSGQELRFISGSSHEAPTFRRVQRILDGRQLDLLFIDGDHSYEGARDDFLMYSQLVRTDGAVLFHDIVPDHGASYGRPSPALSGGVPLLWQQLQQAYLCKEVIRNRDQDGMGIGILYWDPSIPWP